MTIADVTEFLFWEDDPREADAILVFGGRHKERALKAAELYQNGYAPRIFITGADTQQTGRSVSDALRETCVGAGVPTEAVFTESKSANTLENVQAATRWLDTELGLRNVHRVIAVSRPSQARRIRLTLRRFLPKEVEVLVIPDNRTDFTKENWWHSETGRDAVFRELEKVRSYAQQGVI
jgi:uncharacterized SAM-binding protein YcdF (DUF218 family)